MMPLGRKGPIGNIGRERLVLAQNRDEGWFAKIDSFDTAFVARFLRGREAGASVSSWMFVLRFLLRALNSDQESIRNQVAARYLGCRARKGGGGVGMYLAVLFGKSLE
jgi:hypothetical protein